MKKNRLKVLISDELHFHDRNFKSFLDFLKDEDAILTKAKAPASWLALYGDYSSKTADLRLDYEFLSSLSYQDLKTYSYLGVGVFEACKLEFLSGAVFADRWQVRKIPSDTDQLFDLAVELDYFRLIENMAAVMFWADWWSDKLKSVRRQEYVAIFSGCLIYQKVLVELLKYNPAEPLIFESFFTGNDYYCENRYSHIPNNSDLALEVYYRSIKVSGDLNEYDRSRQKAINKIRLAKNKNVTQPEISEPIVFENDEGVVVIIGQVFNDFSILGTRLDNINSSYAYCELIDLLLDRTKLNIIFKAHPWERKKNILGRPITQDTISNHLENRYSSSSNNRLVFTEDYNLGDLLRQSDYVVTICSQAAIEAAYLGIKPIQFGSAFYGKKGFTSDFLKLEDLVDSLAGGSLAKKLTLEEYDLFEKFCVKVFCGHMVSVHPSGKLRLRDILGTKKYVPLI